MVYQGYANANDPNPSSGAYGLKYASYGPNALGYAAQDSYGKGTLAGTQTQNWMQGFMGSNPFGGFGGSSGKYLSQLEGSQAYQGLLSQGAMPWEQYYGKVGPQLEQLYGDVSKQAQSWLNNANPSGVTALNAQQLYAQGMDPVQQQASALRNQLGVQGGKTGGMSGTASLASLAPSQMLGKAGGQNAIQASIGANQSEMQRGQLNAGMKGQALGVLNSANQAQAGQLGSMLAQHASIGQNAYAAAMQALAQLLGIEASTAPKFSASYDSSTGAFTPSWSFQG